MSDLNERLAGIERRLQQLELTGVRPIDPLAPSQPPMPAQMSSTLRNLLFWLGLVVVGIVIWEFSSNLKN